jgi:hypothetical protein
MNSKAWSGRSFSSLDLPQKLIHLKYRFHHALSFQYHELVSIYY